MAIKKQVFQMVGWGSAIACLLVVMGFVKVENQNVKCEVVEIDIDYSAGNFFVEPEDINSMVEKEGMYLTGKPVSAINFQFVEDLLSTNHYVKDVQVYSTLSGNLKIKVKQRTPILRVMDPKKGDYYIDENGLKMPASSSYTARVMVANGNVESVPFDDLNMLATFVNKNKFWKSQISQIYVDWTGEIQMIPRVGNHKIILGDCSMLEQKFKKLYAFYKDGLNKIGWNRYKSIDLKFKDQVVCKK
jgi:cell division protein FtsQ